MIELPDSTELPDNTDVLVVGAGPTGLTVAASLAAAHVRSVIIDRVPPGENFSRAVGTVPRSLEMLAPLGIAGRVADISHHAKRVRVFSGDRDRNIVTLRLDRLSTRFPYIAILAQHVLEETIADRLRELGTEVLRPAELTGLEQDGSGVTATVTGPDGAERAIRAKYVVGADGPRSTVRSLAGVRFPGVTFRQPFVLADMRLSSGPPDDEIHLFFSRQGAVIMGHMPEDVYRVCLSLDEAPQSTMTAEQAEDLLLERGPARYQPKVTEVLHSSRTRVDHRIAERFRTGRVLLAGDAAHLNSPIIGQGMNLGIQEGVTLAVALIDTLRTGVDSLDRYERIRRPIATSAVGITRHINEFATLTSPWKGALRDALFPVANFPPLNKQICRRLSRLIDRRDGQGI